LPEIAVIRNSAASGSVIACPDSWQAFLYPSARPVLKLSVIAKLETDVSIRGLNEEFYPGCLGLQGANTTTLLG
jgi:hypothetical protein